MHCFRVEWGFGEGFAGSRGLLLILPPTGNQRGRLNLRRDVCACAARLGVSRDGSKGNVREYSSNRDGQCFGYYIGAGAVYL